MSEDPDPSTLEIQVAVEDPAWHGAIPELVELVEQVSATTLRHPAVRDSQGGSTELSILLADDEVVRRLNKAFRARDRATNVLSFAYRETESRAGVEPNGPSYVSCLGDVALARQTIAREATAQGKSLSDHLSHLLVHGVLHLCGFDHGSDADAREMERLEQEILAGLGIGDPYRVAPAERLVT